MGERCMVPVRREGQWGVLHVTKGVCEVKPYLKAHPLGALGDGIGGGRIKEGLWQHSAADSCLLQLPSLFVSHPSCCGGVL